MSKEDRVIELLTNICSEIEANNSFQASIIVELEKIGSKLTETISKLEDIDSSIGLLDMEDAELK